MKYQSEFRDAKAMRRQVAAIHDLVTGPWTLMEICGGQTHAIMRYGLDRLLPSEVTLIHGPGCPVCVTPLETIDRALAIAARPEVIFCSFGDMARVPGSRKDLLTVKAEGADVRLVYSPLDALELAKRHPDREVVFLAVGFETTAPTTAMAVRQAAKLGLVNFSLVCAHVLVPPAMRALLSSRDHPIQGFLAAGHVCTVTGYAEYYPLAERFDVPIVVTGFEPLDILQGVYLCLRELESGRSAVVNQYSRAVREDGNQTARALIHGVFRPVDRKWRGMGTLPSSGLALNDGYAAFDAVQKFAMADLVTEESETCISGEILRGRKKPCDCPAFATACNPDHPLGATMVSNEGACSAYFRYRVPHQIEEA
ncbi:hydrogenase formation protein HypD [Sulfidibacter corallicola]|uniref:Hydrogenase formation protein HypD n=1 Tax=Sulfidibacter corallicola TaxID=2818388 RepID=A0A8A4U4F9_SULCO|nr:hydrogenase formation protein HypD [Sulfidibacter corallicola]QTD53635.1 hydrogenase formation protein HypD [Sulfidibacter corallicola]